MEEQEYLEERLTNQINWYDKKSQTNQKCFKRLRILEIIAAAIIPFLAGAGTKVPYSLIIIGILGVMIAVSSCISTLYKYNENWISYRNMSESLQREKILFQTKCSPYNDNDAFRKLVHRVEGLISKENSQWSTAMEEDNT